MDDYLTWLNDSENGLMKERIINGLQIKVKYLPPDYLSLKDKSSRNTDSLKDYYSHSLSFLLSINPEQVNQKDIVYREVNDYSDYKARIYQLSFRLDELISVEIENMKITPVLTSFENVYGIKQGRDIIVVFTPSDENQAKMIASGNIDFIFNDEIFKTGISHFQFIRSDIENAPAIDFSNKQM
ncbi:MAG: hypothetical protein A2X08_14595 [Bacteroidetes bacterium GWA2_32_17]|nr:MAG: hypothetical protein A2X08_14595 [Bacteroidetes bacterium GWA2_32_17]